MKSSKKDQKKKNAIFKTFDDEKVMKIENCRNRIAKTENDGK